jgi:hypothetical protein
MTILLLVICMGCGGMSNPLPLRASIPVPTPSPTPSPTPTPTPSPIPIPNPSVPLNENWHFSSATNNVFSIDAALGRGPGTIEGAAYINEGSTCFWATVNQGDWMALMPLSGTIDSQNQVTMHSAAINGSVLSLTGNMAADGSALTGVRYVITGCGADKAGDAEGKRYQPVTGTYKGVLTLNGEQLATTVEVVQSATANVANPFQQSGIVTLPFLLSGTVTITGTHCSETWQTNIYSGILGNSLGLLSSVSDTDITGYADPDGMNLTVESYPYTDACSAGATGTLQRQ